jgi:hypothetical protein
MPSYKEWLKWRKGYFKRKNDMDKKNWKDLFIGASLISLSIFLYFNSMYTIEIAILIGILTLWWLEFF